MGQSSDEIVQSSSKRDLEDLQSTEELWPKESLLSKLDKIFRFEQAELNRQLAEVGVSEAENASKMNRYEREMNRVSEVIETTTESFIRTFEPHLDDFPKKLQAIHDIIVTRQRELNERDQQLKSRVDELHQKLNKISLVRSQFEEKRDKFADLVKNEENSLVILKAYLDFLKLYKEDESCVNDKDGEIKQIREKLRIHRSMVQDLITSSGLANDMSIDARKTLIDALRNISPTTEHMVHVKSMKELDVAAICAGSRVKDNLVIELSSLWESLIRDASWYPFKVITKNGKSKEMLDEDDEKLKILKNDLGMDAYQAVAKALEEMIEYKPGSRHPVPCLWNGKEGREATIKEANLSLTEYYEPSRKKPRID